MLVVVALQTTDKVIIDSLTTSIIQAEENEVSASGILLLKLLRGKVLKSVVSNKWKIWKKLQFFQICSSKKIYIFNRGIYK